jgi:RNA-directed DNA polymerase
MMIEELSSGTGLPVAFIQKLARGASHEYKQYVILKRTGGYRTIFHPSKRLKALQRWLLENIVGNWPVHSAAMAYRKGISTYLNAAAHADSRYLLRMDFHDFFPSITDDDIRSYFTENPGLALDWTSLDLEVFCQIVCRNQRLTIGAPTSPSLSNALCYEMDVRLHSICARNTVVYTRYADDLFFSATTANVLRNIEGFVEQVVVNLPYPKLIRINKAKTRHSSKRGRRRVTGIVLGSDGHPHVGRDLKRRIRSLIYHFDSLEPQSKASLAGLIAYAVGLEPEFMNSLINKYGLDLVRRAKTPPTMVS